MKLQATSVFHVNLNTHLEKLDKNSELAITWFERNYMKLEKDKLSLNSL